MQELEKTALLKAVWTAARRHAAFLPDSYTTPSGKVGSPASASLPSPCGPPAKWVPESPAPAHAGARAGCGGGGGRG